MEWFGRVLFLVLTVKLASSEVPIKGNDKPDKVEKSRMVGVDTVHDIPINKDTIITRNFVDNSKAEWKTRGKNGKHANAPKENEREPDWSYASFPAEVKAHVTQFKKNMTECLKEVQASDKRTVKRLSPKQESPVHGECLIACVLRRNGVIEPGKNLNNKDETKTLKINKANLINLVSKFYAKDTKLMKKLEKNIDRCLDLSNRIQNECYLAAQLNECTNDLMANNKHKIVVNY